MNFFPFRLNSTASWAAVLFCFATTTVAHAQGAPQNAARPPAAPFTALSVLPRFVASDVPRTGPGEVPVDPPTWHSRRPMEQAPRPGRGAAEHPMLYIGEGCNTMFVVRDGKVIWSYATGQGGEFDDIWMLSNGNIIFSRMSYAEEVTPRKQVVWHLAAPAGTEIHSLQPVGLDQVLLIENGLPPKILLLDKRTGETVVAHDLPAPSTTDRGTVHAQFRRVRLTGNGTYLVPYLEMGRVVEYDREFHEIWSYKIPTPWAAIRLQNGNTLITDESEALTREVNPRGETVWEFKLSALPAEFHFTGSQSCVRLGNGHTILCSRGNGGEGCQLVEITPDQQVVSAMYDWKTFGPATAIQALDDPGRPETPGDLQR